ncbi:hypothetical protein AU476_10705 [Cupriavidus sp. UYMSc13B]|nr:hypothetical protein AU476_10705 [Cupriavidus sp. UYMSc13B]
MSIAISGIYIIYGITYGVYIGFHQSMTGGQPMTRITVKPLASSLGAEVSGVDLRQPLDHDTLSELQEAWGRHLVLRFRGQA